MRLPTRILLGLTVLLLAEAAGVAIMPSLLRVLAGWLEIWPAPTEHFAALLGDLGWPIAVLLIAWMLRRPIQRAAYLLSERMRRDNLEFGGFLKITAAEFNTMDRRLLVDHTEAAPEAAQDIDLAESLLEYAGRSDSHARRLLDWVLAVMGTETDPEAFLLEPQFAEARQRAYVELIKGQSDG